MTTHTHVPADLEADSIIDLIEDCREIAGLLGSFVPIAAVIPAARDEVTLNTNGAVLPDARGAMPIEISPETVRSLDGYADYGS